MYSNLWTNELFLLLKSFQLALLRYHPLEILQVKNDSHGLENKNIMIYM